VVLCTVGRQQAVRCYARGWKWTCWTWWWFKLGCMVSHSSVKTKIYKRDARPAHASLCCLAWAIWSGQAEDTASAQNVPPRADSSSVGAPSTPDQKARCAATPPRYPPPTCPSRLDPVCQNSGNHFTPQILLGPCLHER
jgi:hypothetical protein